MSLSSYMKCDTINNKTIFLSLLHGFKTVCLNMLGTKRLKSSKLISWQPILSDDYLRTEPFRLEPFVVADIKDTKQTSALIKELHEAYPFDNQPNQYKRVRGVSGVKGSSSLLQIIISEKKHFKGLTNELESKVANVTELKLPVDRILTRKQYELVVANYWPIQFHPDKRVETLLDRKTFEKVEEKLLIRSDFYSRLVADLAQFYKSPAAALIVDPKKDKIVGSG